MSNNKNVFLRDLDETGSMHPCWKGDEGSVEYTPVNINNLLAQLKRIKKDWESCNKGCSVKIPHGRYKGYWGQIDAITFDIDRGAAVLLYAKSKRTGEIMNNDYVDSRSYWPIEIKDDNSWSFK
jgi:hypothetical protein